MGEIIIASHCVFLIKQKKVTKKDDNCTVNKFLTYCYQIHEHQPFTMKVGWEEHSVSYVPGESNTYVFGGNSNWRGPIWLPGKADLNNNVTKSSVVSSYKK